jgi:hypothetical protein
VAAAAEASCFFDGGMSLAGFKVIKPDLLRRNPMEAAGMYERLGRFEDMAGGGGPWRLAEGGLVLDGAELHN